MSSAHLRVSKLVAISVRPGPTEMRTQAPKFRRFAYRAFSWVALATTLAGCIVEAPPPRHYYVGTVVETAPPPPRVEEYGPPPAPGYVWFGGYWVWRGERHEWVPGHWERGRPNYRWVPHHWVHERDGWHLVDGHWERR